MDIYYSTEDKLLKIDRLLDYGNYRKAKLLLTEVLEDQPDNAFAHFSIGWIFHTRLYEYVQAENHYRLAQKFNPALTVVYYDYIRLLNLLQKTTHVRELVEKALQVPGVRPDFCWNELGLACEKSGDYAEAVSCYHKAFVVSTEKYLSDEYQDNLERVKRKIGMQADYIYCFR
ncbi:MAG: hypothetical protein FD123_1126 [Bacteroidetes bacterium]|nr:MAG: hypothetical protein FD123_1126 [Bacteroidota bacterium]